MYCKSCKTFNSGGRETCQNCGKALLDLHGIMAKDQWVGLAMRIAGWGFLIGGIAGTLIGIGLGIWLDSADTVGGAISGAISGAELGIPCGGIIGGAIGVYKHSPRGKG
jgi:hypothetical protein